MERGNESVDEMAYNDGKESGRVETALAIRVFLNAKKASDKLSPEETLIWNFLEKIVSTRGK